MWYKKNCINVGTKNYFIKLSSQSSCRKKRFHNAFANIFLRIRLPRDEKCFHMTSEGIKLNKL